MSTRTIWDFSQPVGQRRRQLADGEKLPQLIEPGQPQTFTPPAQFWPEGITPTNYDAWQARAAGGPRPELATPTPPTATADPTLADRVKQALAALSASQRDAVLRETTPATGIRPGVRAPQQPPQPAAALPAPGWAQRYDNIPAPGAKPAGPQPPPGVLGGELRQASPLTKVQTAQIKMDDSFKEFMQFAAQGVGKFLMAPQIATGVLSKSGMDIKSSDLVKAPTDAKTIPAGLAQTAETVGHLAGYALLSKFGVAKGIEQAISAGISKVLPKLAASTVGAASSALGTAGFVGATAAAQETIRGLFTPQEFESGEAFHQVAGALAFGLAFGVIRGTLTPATRNAILQALPESFTKGTGTAQLAQVLSTAGGGAATGLAMGSLHTAFQYIKNPKEFDAAVAAGDVASQALFWAGLDLVMLLSDPRFYRPDWVRISKPRIDDKYAFLSGTRDPAKEGFVEFKPGSGLWMDPKNWGQGVALREIVGFDKAGAPIYKHRQFRTQTLKQAAANAKKPPRAATVAAGPPPQLPAPAVQPQAQVQPPAPVVTPPATGKAPAAAAIAPAVAPTPKPAVVQAGTSVPEIVAQLAAKHNPDAKSRRVIGNVSLDNQDPHVTGLLQALGQQATGVRLADAEETGVLRYMLEKGEIDQSAWDAHVAMLQRENRIAAPEMSSDPSAPVVTAAAPTQPASPAPTEVAPPESSGTRSVNFTQFLAEKGVKDPGLDHGPLSPSGTVSKAARTATSKRRDQERAAFASAQREYQDLINRGEVVDPTGRYTAMPVVDEAANEAARLRQRAAQLRSLAEQGMKPKVHAREAAKLEAQADALEGKATSAPPAVAPVGTAEPGAQPTTPEPPATTVAEQQPTIAAGPVQAPVATPASDVPTKTVTPASPQKQPVATSSVSKPVKLRALNEMGLHRAAMGRLWTHYATQAKDGVLVSTDGDIAVRTKTTLADGLYEARNKQWVPYPPDKAGQPTKELPASLQPSDTKGSSELSGDQVNAFIRALTHTAVNDTRPVLTTVCLKVEDGRAEVVATDGFRLHREKIDAGGLENGTYLVPPAALKVLKKEDLRNGVRVQLGEGNITFDSGRVQVTAKLLLEGQFPPYMQVWPKQVLSMAVFNHAEFRAALDDLSQWFPKTPELGFYPIRFAPVEGGYRLTYKDDTVEKHVDLKATVVDSPVPTADLPGTIVLSLRPREGVPSDQRVFQYRYLADMVQAHAGPLLHMGLVNDGRGTALFWSADSVQEVASPAAPAAKTPAKTKSQPKVAPAPAAVEADTPVPVASAVQPPAAKEPAAVQPTVPDAPAAVAAETVPDAPAAVAAETERAPEPTPAVAPDKPVVEEKPPGTPVPESTPTEVTEKQETPDPETKSYPNTATYPVRKGALTDVPVYENHPKRARAKNWLAVIKENPRERGGLERKWQTRGYGDFYYLVDGLRPGDAVEFGADYISSGGNRTPNRWYGVVASVSEDALSLIPAGSAREAIEIAAEFGKPKTVPSSKAAVLPEKGDVQGAVTEAKETTKAKESDGRVRGSSEGAVRGAERQDVERGDREVGTQLARFRQEAERGRQGDIVYARPDSPPPQVDNRVSADLAAPLKPHQVEGVNLALNAFANGRAFLLADGTGAGKTAQGLAVAAQLQREGASRILILTAKPTVVTDAWLAQDKEIFDGKIGARKWSPGDDGPGIFVSTYSQLRVKQPVPTEGWDAVIFDESQNLKNMNNDAPSQQALLGLALLKNTPKVMFMSATPFDKLPEIAYLGPALGLFRDVADMDRWITNFGYHVGLSTVNTKYGTKRVKKYTRVGSPRVAEIDEMWADLTRKGFMIKREVPMTGLEVVVRGIELPDEAFTAMDTIARNFGTDALEVGRMYNAMRRHIENFKVEATVKLALEEIAKGRQVAIFSTFKEESTLKRKGSDIEDERTIYHSESVMRQLRDALSKAVGKDQIAEVHGGLTGESKPRVQAEIDAYQTGKKKVLLSTLSMGSAGISLHDESGTAPRTQIMMSLPWSALEHVQAAGRSHRLTSKSDTRLYVLMSNTEIDRRITSVLAPKMALLGAVVSGDIQNLDVDRGLAYGDQESGSVINDIVNPAARAGPREDVRDHAVDAYIDTVNETPGKSDGVAPDVLRPITRQEIVAELSEKLDIPIRVGRYRNRALGIFKRKERVIRTRKAHDLKVITHEVGHYLDDRLDLSADTQHRNELALLGANTSAPSYSRARVRREGVAEFMRLYLTSPAQAQAQAPGFYAAFEQKMLLHPDIHDVLLRARQDIANYYAQSPRARILAHMSIGKPARRMPLTLNRLYQMVVDDLRPLEVAVKEMTEGQSIPITEDPFRLAWLSRGWSGTADAWLHYGQLDRNFNKIGPSLDEILKPVAHDLNGFRAYIAARQAREMQAQGKETGFDDDAIAAELQTDDPVMAKAFAELIEFQDGVLQMLVGAGVTSPEAVKAMRKANRNYVPFHRVFDENMGSSGFARNKGFANLSSPVKRRKGSTQPIIDPLETVIKNTYLMTQIAARNRVGRALVNLAEATEGGGAWAEQVPAPLHGTQVRLEELITDLQAAGLSDDAISQLDLEHTATIFRPSLFAPGKENILTVLRNGKPEYWQLPPELYRAMLFLDEEKVHWLVRLFSYPTQWLRAGATLSPDFMGKNPARDQLTAFLFSKYGYVPVVDFFRGLFHVIKRDDLYWKWMASGGANSSLVSLDRDYMQVSVRALTRQKMAQRVKDIITHPIQVLQALSEAGEQATRVGEFRRGLQREGTSREGVLLSSLSSRDVAVDFLRKGTGTTIWRRWIPFFNAAIQGTDKMARQFRTDPKGTLLRALLTITLPTIMLYLRNRKDPRYQELPRWRKDLNWNFSHNNRMVSVPKPFEMGILFGTAVERMLDFALEQDPTALDGLGDLILEVGAPGGIPQWLVGWVEQYANRNMYTSAPLIPARELGLEPWAQYGPHTSEVAKAAGKIINVSPRVIDNYIRSVTGGLGRYAVEGMDAVLKVTGVVKPPPEPAKDLSDMPVLRAFVPRTLSFDAASITDFHKAYEDAEKRYKTLTQVGRPLKKGDETLLDLQRMRDANKSLSELRSASREVYASETMTPQQKKDSLDAIAFIMINVARYGLGRPLLMIDKGKVRTIDEPEPSVP